jgi:hypothetical protein
VECPEATHPPLVTCDARLTTVANVEEIKEKEGGEDKFTSKRVDTLQTGAAFRQEAVPRCRDIISVSMYASALPERTHRYTPIQSSNCHPRAPFHLSRAAATMLLEAHRVVGIVPPFQLELLVRLQLVVFV